MQAYAVEAELEAMDKECMAFTAAARQGYTASFPKLEPASRSLTFRNGQASGHPRHTSVIGHSC